MVFSELLIASLSAHRARTRIRTAIGRGHTFFHKGARQPDGESQMPPSAMHSVVAAFDSPQTQWQKVIAAALVWDRARRQRLRNRWHLARFLLVHPELRAFRSSARRLLDTHPELEVIKLRVRQARAGELAGTEAAERAAAVRRWRVEENRCTEVAYEHASAVAELLAKEEEEREMREAAMLAEQADAVRAIEQQHASERVEALEDRAAKERAALREQARKAREAAAKLDEEKGQLARQVGTMNERVAAGKARAIKGRLNLLGMAASREAERRRDQAREREQLEEIDRKHAAERRLWDIERGELLAKLSAMAAAHAEEQQRLKAKSSPQTASHTQLRTPTPTRSAPSGTASAPPPAALREPSSRSAPATALAECNQSGAAPPACAAIQANGVCHGMSVPPHAPHAVPRKPLQCAPAPAPISGATAACQPPPSPSLGAMVPSPSVAPSVAPSVVPSAVLSAAPSAASSVSPSSSPSPKAPSPASSPSAVALSTDTVRNGDDNSRTTLGEQLGDWSHRLMSQWGPRSRAELAPISERFSTAAAETPQPTVPSGEAATERAATESVQSL